MRRSNDNQSNTFNASETQEKSVTPSGISHSFDIAIAKECGINAAILYTHLCFWITKNIISGINFHEGRTWTYDSREAITRHFPYMTIKEVRLGLERLVEKKLIITGHFHENKFNRELWYALPDENILKLETNSKSLFDMPQKANASASKGKTITDTKHTDSSLSKVSNDTLSKEQNAPSGTSLMCPEKHIKITQEEHKQLVEKFGEETTAKCYKRLSEWKQDTPKKNWKLSDYRSIIRWVVDAVTKETLSQKSEKFDFRHPASNKDKMFHAKKVGVET